MGKPKHSLEGIHSNFLPEVRGNFLDSAPPNFGITFGTIGSSVPKFRGLHPRSFGICFGIVKNIRVLSFFFHVSGPLTGMYYEIIPRNFVKICSFKNITRTNEIISRNFVRIYGFINITGTSGFLVELR
jgi:hypothetical protein